MISTESKLGLYSLLTLVLLLLGLEGALRLAGFGFSAPEFRPPPPPCLVLGACNGGTGGLFVKKGPELSLRPEYNGWFHEQSFPALKPAGEFRVFILGGSSIYNLYGQMENSYGDAGRRVRVVNLGGNSFGTARLLPVFDEVLGYSPDLVLIYSGHNEFVDIRLVTDVLRATPLQRELRALLRPSRVCQLGELAVYKTGMRLMRMRKKRGPGFMRYFSTHKGPDTDRAGVYALYREYLAAMVKKAAAGKVPVELATVGYNRLSAPAGPAAAVELHKKGLDLLREGKPEEALRLLDRALDMETTPLGANETSNGIVREIAGRYRVPLLDVDAVLAGQAPGGIPGYELFSDQCHFKDSTFLGELFRKEIRAAITAGNRAGPGTAGNR